MKYNTIQLFVYYGVVLNKLEAVKVSLLNKEKDFSALTKRNNLSYEPVGRESYSDKIIVGKKVICSNGEPNFLLDPNLLSFSSGKFDGLENIASLNDVDQDQVINDLKSIKINKKPNFYVFYTFT